MAGEASEVWWVEFDSAVGSEVRKTRPAVAVSNDAANHLARVVVVSLTSNASRQYPGEALVRITDKQAKAMADQIIAANKTRLKKPPWYLVKTRYAGGIGCDPGSFGNAQVNE